MRNYEDHYPMSTTSKLLIGLLLIWLMLWLPPAIAGVVWLLLHLLASRLGG